MKEKIDIYITDPDVEKKEEQTQGVATFEGLLAAVGEFGRCQVGLFLLLGWPAVVCAMHMLAWVFLGAYSGHRCVLPDEQQEAPNASLAVFSTPALLNGSWTVAPGMCELQPPGQANPIPCQEFVFDTSHVLSSAVFEFGLVCKRSWLRAMVDTAFMFGTLGGSLVFGSSADIFGRRPVLLCALTLQVCVGILASLAPSYWTFVMARFALGVTLPGVYISSCVIGMELVGPSRRQVAGVFLNMFFSLGYVLTAGVARLIPGDWRLLQLTYALPGLLFLSYYWIVPESARWLVSQGRVAEASHILQKVAVLNRSKVSAGELDKQLTEVAEATQRQREQGGVHPSLLGVLRFPALARHVAIILLVWMVNNLSYFGFSFNAGSLGGSLHVNFVISGAVEVPAYVIVIFAVDTLGRRVTQSLSLLITGVTLLAIIPLVLVDVPWLVTTLSMLGKMASTASVGCAYVITAEILPTSVRNAGMGACAMAAGIGAMIAPMVLLLRDVWLPLPSAVLGGVALTAGLLALLLPETKGYHLSETLEEGDAFCRGEKTIDQPASKHSI